MDTFFLLDIVSAIISFIRTIIPCVLKCYLEPSALFGK